MFGCSAHRQRWKLGSKRNMTKLYMYYTRHSFFLLSVIILIFYTPTRHGYFPYVYSGRVTHSLQRSNFTQKCWWKGESNAVISYPTVGRIEPRDSPIDSKLSDFDTRLFLILLIHRQRNFWTLTYVFQLLFYFAVLFHLIVVGYPLPPSRFVGCCCVDEDVMMNAWNERWTAEEDKNLVFLDIPLHSPGE